MARAGSCGHEGLGGAALRLSVSPVSWNLWRIWRSESSRRRSRRALRPSPTRHADRLEVVGVRVCWVPLQWAQPTRQDTPPSPPLQRPSAVLFHHRSHARGYVDLQNRTTGAVGFALHHDIRRQSVPVVVPIWHALSVAPPPPPPPRQRSSDARFTVVRPDAPDPTERSDHTSAVSQPGPASSSFQQLPFPTGWSARAGAPPSGAAAGVAPTPNPALVPDASDPSPLRHRRNQPLQVVSWPPVWISLVMELSPQGCGLFGCSHGPASAHTRARVRKHMPSLGITHVPSH